MKQITFELQGAPRNFTNRREHWAKAWREKQSWWANTALLGMAKRRQAGWPVAEWGQRRDVVITCYRVRLMDDDGNTIAVKSIRDALQCKTAGKSEKMGEKRIAVPKIGAGLISSDGDPAASILVRQVRVAKFKEQRVLVSVTIPDAERVA